MVLTGDIHEHYANDLKADYDVPGSSTVGVELVTTSVTSGGDSPGADFEGDPENPRIRFTDDMRGYVRTKITSSEIRADFRVLPYVKEAGAPAKTKASFVIAARVPGLHPA